MTTAKQVPVRYYRFRNHLRNKAIMGFGDDGSPGRIDPEALAAAENEFEKMAEDYPDWVQGHIRSMYEQLGRCLDAPEERMKHFTQLSLIAHDMKGQGGTFGYDLISTFGQSLYNFTDTHKNRKIKDNHVEIVRAHIDAMKAVIGGRIKGDGGETGTELIASLETAIEKYEDVIGG